MSSIMRRLVLLPIWFYRLCISPFTPPSCRFVPTCSDYAAQAVERFGAFKGGWLTLRRLLRCHPFSHRNGYDPVPEPLAQSSESCKTEHHHKND